MKEKTKVSTCLLLLLVPVVTPMDKLLIWDELGLKIHGVLKNPLVDHVDHHFTMQKWPRRPVRPRNLAPPAWLAEVWRVR